MDLREISGVCSFVFGVPAFHNFFTLHGVHCSNSPPCSDRSSVQSRNKIDFSTGPGIAVREYQTDVGPADYVLLVDKKPVGVTEAKPEDWGQKITTVEDQSGAYATAKTGESGLIR